MIKVNPISAASIEVRPEPAVRCSIILFAGSNFSRLSMYLLGLSEMKLYDEYEIIVINDHDIKINEGQLRTFLPSLKVLNVSELTSREQLLKEAVMAARGKFLLFVRNFVNFDKLILEESIKDLETSCEKISISSNRNFVLAEKLHCTSGGGFEQLFDGVYSALEAEPRMPSSKIDYFRNLSNERIPFRYAPGTFIDPDVIIESPDSIRIGSNCIIRKGVVLRPEGGEIIIGDNCVINHYCMFHGKGGIYLGDWTIVDPHCGFYAQNHTYENFDVPITKQQNTGKGIYLMGDNWIGGHSVICDDVTIGKGAVVGANSTVTKSISMASVAVGSPAKVIKKRYSGDWNFQKQERAINNGMPLKIHQYVRERGLLIKELIGTKDSVLDVGCGEGIITAIIAEKAPNIIGCDYSIEAIDVARQQYPGIKFIYSNSTNLVFPDKSFKTVILSDVAEHLLPVQFVKALAEIYRVLKTGGKLIVATPITGKQKNTSTYAHIYEYSEAEMKQILCEMFHEVELVNERFGLFVAQKR
jgi:acetyltransferase-like isoleucine patch superfamily enzyme/ubiquinone/menaquinone biosynthesis C-methylase UbiE